MLDDTDASVARLESLIVQKPRNAKLRAKLALLLDKQDPRALALATEAVELAPTKPYGHVALSYILQDRSERQRELKKAIECADKEPELFEVSGIELRIRKLTEPIKNESTTVGKGSDRHPCRRKLTKEEHLLYNQTEERLQTAYQTQASDALSKAEYNLGCFFRKRDTTCAIHHFRRSKDPMASFWLATLNDTTMDRCPPAYIQSLYSTFAPRFDSLLVDKLRYETPTLLRKLLPPECRFSKCLDLGCGTGLSGLAFDDCVDEIVGLDLSSDMLEYARKRHFYNDLCQGDVESTKWIQEFDLVLACDVLVYLGDLTRVFQRVYESLGTKGIFLASVELYKGPENYRLHECARFCHAQDYVESSLTKSGLFVEEIKPATIRLNQGKPVMGLLFRALKSHE